MALATRLLVLTSRHVDVVIVLCWQGRSGRFGQGPMMVHGPGSRGGRGRLGLCVDIVPEQIGLLRGGGGQSADGLLTGRRLRAGVE